MNSEVKYCKDCAITAKNTLKLNEKASEYSKGYIIGFPNDIETCPFCKSHLEEVPISSDDIFAIRDASNYNRELLEAMISLRKKDVIEYELKMSQFRTQAKQQAQIKQNQENINKPKCPTCQSTNVRRITTADKLNAIWAAPVDRELYCIMKCLNCGYKW